MPLTLDLSVADLASTRFAISPLSETISGLQQLGDPRLQETNLRWMRWASDELAARPLGLSRTWPLIVNDRPHWPQFLLPAPIGAGRTIDDDLAAMRRTTARQVRDSLQRVFGDDLPDGAVELAAHPAAELRAIATELREAHDRLIAPYWSRIRAVLDADIAYRAKQLAAGGAARLFADLHPDLRWHDGRLTLQRWRSDRIMNPAPGGLVLLPVVLGTAYVLIKGNTTTHTTVRYPARGVGALWTAGTRPASGSAVRLLGRPRAELLEALRSPATTTDLARALKVSPSAVSQHLSVLRDSGLVVGERTGRSVLYLTTERGLALLDPKPR
ncbi:helix-turn-helix domain-containing protein [Micromonospora sp. NBC_01699]|uniref:helix-turn-helix domain-containing protein n=1 Tax=Micromonospora sp. NBC_01699 TaxID=2975984 RepID=UPI002E36839B|nr:helix-turn-helix domain-containing protein [Micromonospora sp. NBC_01699]